MFKAQPKTEITKFINAYKSASSRLIKRDYPRVKQYLWKEMFWSKGFCLLTTGGAPIDVIKKYIQNQGNNHK
jgi:putative transposase